MESLSIGAMNVLKYEPWNDRDKGFLSITHNSVEELASTLCDVVDECQEGSRVTVRVVVSEDYPVREYPKGICWQGVTLVPKAVVPICKDGVGAIVYFGANTDQRIDGFVRDRVQDLLRIPEQEWFLIRQAEKAERKSKPLPDGYTVGILPKKVFQQDLQRLLEIYQGSYSTYITELNARAVGEMVQNNTIAVVRNSWGSIVAVSQAEVALIELAEQDWQLIELTEYAADPKAGGNGFCRMCNELLVQKLSGPHSIIYSETRANSGAALGSNPVPMLVGGRLPAHCKMDSTVKDVPQVGPYANLCVWYLPQGNSEKGAE